MLLYYLYYEIIQKLFHGFSLKFISYPWWITAFGMFWKSVYYIFLSVSEQVFYLQYTSFLFHIPLFSCLHFMCVLYNKYIWNSLKHTHNVCVNKELIISCFTEISKASYQIALNSLSFMSLLQIYLHFIKFQVKAWRLLKPYSLGTMDSKLTKQVWSSQDHQCAYPQRS